ENEPKSLFQNDGGHVFTDIGLAAGLNDANRFVAFGCRFLDVDNDGWLDLAIANGHVQDNIDKIDHSTSYRQHSLLYHSLGKTGASLRFQNVTATAGKDLLRPIVGRGLAVGDYDNDGRMDALIADAEGKPLLLHNESGVQAFSGSGIQEN